MDPSVWYINIDVNTSGYEDEETSSATLQEVHNNVVQVCLLVEGIGKMAKVLSSQPGAKIDWYLLKAIYVVLERAGSTNGIIAAAGMAAAQVMAHASCHEDNIVNLVEKNADYLSFHISTRLRNVIENPGVADVIHFVMKYSSLDMLQHLQQIIEEVSIRYFQM